jgi:hypothetical protein
MRGALMTIMHRKPLGRFVSLTLVLAFYASKPVSAALLDGQILNVDLFHRTTPENALTIVDSGDFLVGPGVELQDFGFRASDPPLPALVDIDASDRQILITLVTDQPMAFQETLQFFDVNDTIPDFVDERVNVNPATNWAGFNDSLETASGNSITIGLGGLQGLDGQFILLDVVPEPAAAALLAVAMPALMATRHRRSGG